MTVEYALVGTLSVNKKGDVKAVIRRTTSNIDINVTIDKADYAKLEKLGQLKVFKGMTSCVGAGLKLIVA